MEGVEDALFLTYFGFFILCLISYQWVLFDLEQFRIICLIGPLDACCSLQPYYGIVFH